MASTRSHAQLQYLCHVLLPCHCSGTPRVSMLMTVPISKPVLCIGVEKDTLLVPTSTRGDVHALISCCREHEQFTRLQRRERHRQYIGVLRTSRTHD